MPDVMLWVTKPDKEGVPSLEDVGDEVGRLDRGSKVDVSTGGSVVHVSFEADKAEQKEIGVTIRKRATGSSRSSRERRKIGPRYIQNSGLFTRIGKRRMSIR